MANLNHKFLKKNVNVFVHQHKQPLLRQVPQAVNVEQDNGGGEMKSAVAMSGNMGHHDAESCRCWFHPSPTASATLGQAQAGSGDFCFGILELKRNNWNGLIKAQEIIRDEFSNQLDKF